jgi:hypothetical protein
MKLCRHCGGAVNVVLPFGDFLAEARCLYCGRADHELEDTLNENYQKRYQGLFTKEVATPPVRRNPKNTAS